MNGPSYIIVGASAHCGCLHKSRGPRISPPKKAGPPDPVKDQSSPDNAKSSRASVESECLTDAEDERVIVVRRGRPKQRF